MLASAASVRGTLATAKSFAKIGGLAAASQEVQRQIGDPTRTAEQSAIEIAAGTVLSGVLGAGMANLNKATRAESAEYLRTVLRKKPATITKVAEDGNVTVDRSVGAAQADVDDVALAGINENVARQMSGPAEFMRSPSIRAVTNKFNTVRKAGDGLFQHDF